MTEHVKEVCRLSYYHIRALTHIRPCLSQKLAGTIACSLVHSRLDYCNSLLNSLSQSNFYKLQRVQNSLARVVLNRRSHGSINLMQELHWLPVKQRTQFKIASLTHKVLHTQVPQYLASCLHSYAPSRDLRSTTSGLLSVPRNKTVCGSFAFEYFAPTLWNFLAKFKFHSLF